MPNPDDFWALNRGLSSLCGEEHENQLVLYSGNAFLLYIHICLLHEDIESSYLKAIKQEVGIYIDLDTYLCIWPREMMPWMNT